MFDSYNVKKILPRIFAGVILIQLSWFLCTGAIMLVNSIAYGIEGLIYAPFGGLSNTSLAEILHGIAGGGGMFITLTTLGTAGVILAAFAVGGVMATALMVLLSVLIAFFLLLFRQVIVIALLLIAPLAIAAWILPGTEKYWKLWWESFSKLLLVYPIILGFIAIGRVMAMVVVHYDPKGGGLFGATQANTGSDSIIKFALAMICLFGPFFLIPKCFQLAGGAFQTLTGTINNKSKGAFDRLRKRRGETIAQNKQKLYEGQRFNRDNIGARAFNRFGAGLGAGAKGHFGIGAAGRDARARVARDAAARQLRENSSLQQLALADDDGIAVMALSGGTHAGAEQAADDLMRSWMEADPNLTEGAARERRDRALGAARAVGVTRANSQAGFELMMKNKARSIVGGEAGQQLLARGVARLHPENEVAQTETAQAAQYFGRESGRSDLGGNWALRGQGESLQDGFNRAGAGKVVRGHTTSVQAHADDLTARWHAARAAGDEVGAQEAAARMVAMRNALGQDVSEENKAIVYTMLQEAGVDTFSPESTDAQFATMVSGIPGANPDATQQHANLRQRSALYEQGTVPPGAPPPVGPPGPPGPPAPPAPPAAPSDARLKTDIKRVGIINGITLYRFSYIWSDEIVIGVMAQDLVKSHPESLMIDRFGFYKVDYSQLGLRVATLEEWTTFGLSSVSANFRQNTEKFSASNHI